MDGISFQFCQKVPFPFFHTQLSPLHHATFQSQLHQINRGGGQGAVTRRGIPRGILPKRAQLADIAIHEHPHKLDHNSQPTPSLNALYLSKLRKGVTWSRVRHSTKFNQLNEDSEINFEAVKTNKLRPSYGCLKFTKCKCLIGSTEKLLTYIVCKKITYFLNSYYQTLQ